MNERMHRDCDTCEYYAGQGQLCCKTTRCLSRSEWKPNKNVFEAELARKDAEIARLKHRLGFYAGEWIKGFLDEISKQENYWMKEYFIASGDIDRLISVCTKAKEETK